jgi:hypothetical protein
MEIMPFGAPLVQGYAFTLLQGTVQASRVRFGIGYAQVWRDWCALQSVCLVSRNTDPANRVYSCAPNWPARGGPNGCILTDPVSGQDIPFDCNKYHLCSAGPCECTEAGCVARVESSATFDMQFRNDELSGSGSVGGTTVRFSRSE